MRALRRKASWCGLASCLALSAGLIVACSGGSSQRLEQDQTLAAPGCASPCQDDALSTEEVARIVSQAVGQALAMGRHATIAVTDRAGNVLAVYMMDGASPTFRIDGQRGVSGGLEGVDRLPSALAAISKAMTGAYLSSAGNAFSTRTASQIIQEHFNPREPLQPAGPLFGVQFSQLPCSDVMGHANSGTAGPKRTPLGLSADAGGLPLYKRGRVVGGVGVMSDGVYGLDLNIQDVDADPDEQIALAATAQFSAPQAIRADRITADGRSLRYTDAADSPNNASGAFALANLPGKLTPVEGYFTGSVRAGVAYGAAASGLQPDLGEFADLGGWIVVDDQGANRFAPRSGTDQGLSDREVRQLLREALSVAHKTRAQIRQPPGQTAQVSITVVDSQGAILGLVRSPDAPVFGIDVAVQKARTAAFFSQSGAGSALLGLGPVDYPKAGAASNPGQYVQALRAMSGNPALWSDGTAFTTRAVGNLARPYFPDGIPSGISGPLSKPFSQWSPFSTGLQLDLSLDAIVMSVSGRLIQGCTAVPQLRNGLQIFPGGVPIYRTQGGQSVLIGAIGVSGDGVDQDDMIAFLGISQAARAMGTGLSQAPAAQRADRIELPGGRLRYVQCPPSAFNDSTQDACAGL